MLLVAAALVVVAGIVVVSLAGALALGRATVGLLAIVAGVAGVVLVGALSLGLLLGRGRDGDHAIVSKTIDATVPMAGTVPVFAPAAPNGFDVLIRALGPESTASDWAILDQLAPSPVLRVRAADFPPDVSGVVEQCTLALDTVSDCDNRFPVRFDGAGSAAFQYQLDAGHCRSATDLCVLVLSVDGPRRVGLAQTVFAHTAPTLSVAVDQVARAGEIVRVHVGGLAIGSPLTVTQCLALVAPCEAGRASSTATAGVAGEAVVSIRVRGCPDRSCALFVVSDGAARVVPMTISAPSGRRADYDGLRLSSGLLFAAACALLAWWLVRTADWRPPTEADTPELDGTSL